MNAPYWVWVGLLILIVLAILYLVGVRFDLNASDMIVRPEV
jgi:hypothetical protein